MDAKLSRRKLPRSSTRFWYRSVRFHGMNAKFKGSSMCGSGLINPLQYDLNGKNYTLKCCFIFVQRYVPETVTMMLDKNF